MKQKITKQRKLSIFEKYLTVWVLLCMTAGIGIGRFTPSIAFKLNALSIYNVSIPIAICLFFMMYPIMVKIPFKKVVEAARNPKPILLTPVSIMDCYTFVYPNHFHIYSRIQSR